MKSYDLEKKTSSSNRSRILNEAFKVNINPDDLLARKTKDIRRVIAHMLDYHGIGIMLSGATGIGKTTFVELLGHLLGMPYILIEAPKITEEHLVNIPYLIKLDNGQEKSGTTKIDPKDPNNSSKIQNEYGLEFAESFLITELNNLAAISDQQLLQNIKNGRQDIRDQWAALGGTDKKIPDEIRAARAKFQSMLFIDEYFRKTTNNVRNILRTILNGYIGTQKIPKKVYVIYASNLSDIGGAVEPIPVNNQFDLTEYRAPTKDEFFHYLYNKYQKHPKAAMKDVVIQAFYDGLTDRDISYDDPVSELRTSPRRWEQLILYVNHSIPVKNAKDAQTLLAAVKAGFTYDDKVSEMYTRVAEIVNKIISATSPAIGNQIASKSSDWRNTLLHQIKVKMALGEARKYVPVVQGPPGIGKTVYFTQIANELNMSLIEIDCSTIGSDAVTGIPMPGKDQNKKRVTSFIEAELYKLIISKMEIADQEHDASPNFTAEQKKKYKTAEYKYILFFDEFTRVKSHDVFNALREVILERKFSSTLKLPDDCIVVAAMNPKDENVKELTGHMKDAMDFIDSNATWSSFEQHIRKNVFRDMDAFPKARLESCWKIVSEIGKEFGTTTRNSLVNSENAPFYLEYGATSTDDDHIWMSPRLYTSFFRALVRNLNLVDTKNKTQEQIGFQIGEEIQLAIVSTIGMAMKHKNVESPQFIRRVTERACKIASGLDLAVGGSSGPQSKADKSISRSDVIPDIGPMLEAALEDSKEHVGKDVGDFSNILSNFDESRFDREYRLVLEKLVLSQQETNNVDYCSIFTKKSYPVSYISSGIGGSPQYKDRAGEKISAIEFLVQEIELGVIYVNLMRKAKGLSEFSQAVVNQAKKSTVRFFLTGGDSSEFNTILSDSGQSMSAQQKSARNEILKKYLSTGK